MKSYLKTTFFKLLLFLMVFALVELIVLYATSSFMYFADKKLDVVTQGFINRAKEVVFSPIQLSKAYFDEKNPMFLVLTGMNFILSIYILAVSRKKKSGWEVHEKNAYHGSSRWAKEKEIFNDGNFKAKKLKDLHAEFLQSLKKNGGD